MTPEELKALVRTVPGFPQPGIQFRDITPLLAHAKGLAGSITALADLARGVEAQAVAGIEARGFIFGTALALELGLGFVPLRKPGKLPVATISEDYALEYGTARLELDPTLIERGERVLLVDDLLATGGTATAGMRLLRRAGAIVEHALFLIDLPDLPGRAALADEGVAAHAVMAFGGH
ncbi:adenine phosphoribosyltransferase [Erythrobacter arachoides]|uniref:Adenine phosphoribosyltransferase n=1 Tax=Aurantiacibacter arachoides TaxID=1850444 RepID=A0A845A3Q6_9SPHN|nr:adenine phosphoribosyltransferase [Aurantiacibacter arachoides]MXO94735.1 adenine phosphoribosyltransferase [Aurantiacibacter arachoides]GGD61047.1 adenine phosphoribosyltransferase [Aurantiacibacter arachoides]